MKSLFLLFSIVATTGVMADIDYCQMQCMDITTATIIQHIGCDHDGQFDKTNCPPDAELIEMTDMLKSYIVTYHNNIRNSTAYGDMLRSNPACRMATMKWDDELAYIASLNVVDCKAKTDACHYTNDFHFPGQNLFILCNSDPIKVDDAKLFFDTIGIWLKGVNHTLQSAVMSYTKYNKEHDISQFANIILEDNIRVGCAASTYIKNNKRIYLVVCNYASSNMEKTPIFQQCVFPAEMCQTGTNPSFPNLCSESEEYNVNKSKWDRLKAIYNFEMSENQGP